MRGALTSMGKQIAHATLVSKLLKSIFLPQEIAVCSVSVMNTQEHRTVFRKEMQGLIWLQQAPVDTTLQMSIITSLVTPSVSFADVGILSIM